MCPELGNLRRLGLEELPQHRVERCRLVEQQLEQPGLDGEVEPGGSLPAVGQNHDAQVRLRQEGNFGDKTQGATGVTEHGLALIGVDDPSHRVVVAGCGEEGR